MKNFMAGVAVLLLLIMFPLQTALELANEKRISRFSDIVYVATQTARTDGYFTEANIANLRNQLRAAFPDLTDADIYIDVTTTPKYRLDVFDERETIQYDIRIPIRRMIVAPGLFGLTEADNGYISERHGFVLSEVPLP